MRQCGKTRRRVLSEGHDVQRYDAELLLRYLIYPVVQPNHARGTILFAFAGSPKQI